MVFDINKIMSMQKDLEKKNKSYTNKRNEEDEINIIKEVQRRDKPPKTKKTSKTYKEGGIMKASSDLVKKTNGRYSVDTEMNIRKGIEPKVKRALRKSVVTELDKKIKGAGIRKINLDLSSDEEKSKKHKKVKKGRGVYGDNDDDSSSSEGSKSSESDSDDDLKEYSKLLIHLVGHITDRKEKLDSKDVKQAKELIDRIKKKRR